MAYLLFPQIPKVTLCHKKSSHPLKKSSPQKHRNSLKSGGAVVGSRFALLGIVVTVGIVTEQCEGLTISTMDHFPPMNAGWLAEVVLKGGAFAPLFCAADRRHN